MRIPTAALTLAVILPACQFHCSRGGVTREEVEKQISEKLTAEAGVAVAVTCPDIKLGETNQCTATAPGGKQFPVEVSGAGDLKWRAENITFGPKLAPLVVKHLREKFDFALPKPRCPPVLAVGDQAACVAKMQGVEVRVTFDVKPDDVYFTDIIGIVASEKVEPWLASQAPEELRPATASCGARLRVSAPDSTFTCTVTGANGKVVDVQIGITSPTGDIKVLGFEPRTE